MNYDLLWNMEEFQTLADYKWNGFHHVNMFTSENITNRERKFNEKSKKYPQSKEEFKKTIEEIIQLYSAIQKNYVLNDSGPYPQQLFRGTRKNSNSSSFTSTSQSLDTAISFMDTDKDNGAKEELIEIDSSQVAWIDLEKFVLGMKGESLEEKEILFVPSVYQTEEEMSFNDYITNNGIVENLSAETRQNINKLKAATYKKVKLTSPTYTTSTNISLDDLVMNFDEYRNNLIKLSAAIKNGDDITQLSEQITKFKRKCSEYIKTQFHEINMQVEQIKQQNNDSNKQIQIDKQSTMKEVHLGNTGRMFEIQSPNSSTSYYFKPAETKDKVSAPYRAYIQEAAYNVQRIVNPTRAIKCNSCIINGTLGAIQEKVDIDIEATKQFRKFFYDNSGSLDPKILSQILDEYLVDYCLCNYDSHASNFVIDKNGNLRGIDKEQAFRYISEDINDDMLLSQNFNKEYGESETIYSTIFKKISSGEISYKILEGLNYRAARLTQIPDSKYREIFKNYAYSKAKTKEEAEMLLDRITARKQSITKKVGLLNEDMFSKWNSKGKGGNEEYMFTDNITPPQQSINQQNINQQKMTSTPLKRPYIKKEVRDIVTGQAFQRQTQNPFAPQQNTTQQKTTSVPLKRPQIKKEVAKNVIAQAQHRQNAKTSVPNKKEELVKQKQALQRAQYKKQVEQMGLNQKQIPNLNDIFYQQQYYQQIKRQQMEHQAVQEEMDHGMSM